MVGNLNKIFLDAVPSIEDERDHKYTQTKAELRSSVDLRKWDSAVEDQGYIGSCVGNAVASAYELTVRKSNLAKFVDLSRLFVYYNSRLFDNSITTDNGTYVRDALKAASKYGMCAESLWPYDEMIVEDQPTPICYVDATQRQVTSYETLYTLRDVIEVLNDNRPVVIGMSLYDGFMEMSSYRPVVALPAEGEELLGYHAVVLVGYDLSTQMFLAKNSFGKDWGDNGYFWIPFEYMRTQVFEKWAFDISNQSTVDIDAPIEVATPVVNFPQIVIETGENGFTVRQTSEDGTLVLYKTE